MRERGVGLGWTGPGEGQQVRAVMTVLLTGELDYTRASEQLSGHGRLLQANPLNSVWSKGPLSPSLLERLGAFHLSYCNRCISD